MGFIYKIENALNGKKYIGSTVCVRRRWSDHRLLLLKGCHNRKLQNSFNKNSKSFEFYNFSVIEECKDEKLIEREQYYINLFDSVDNGYNVRIQASTNYGLKWNEEQKQKLKGRKTPFGLKRSEETKARISIAKKNISDETRVKLSNTKKGKIPKCVFTRRSYAGLNNPSVKLNPDQVLKIRSLYPELSQIKLAKMFNIGQSQVSRIVRGEKWAVRS